MDDYKILQILLDIIGNTLDKESTEIIREAYNKIVSKVNREKPKEI